MSKATEACGCFPTGRHYAGIAHLLRVEAVGVAHEFAAEGAWRDMPVAMLDTETTGRDAQRDRIIEVGIIVGQAGEVIRRHNWLINPGGPIPAAATEVHGITDEQVRDKPRFAEVAGEILEALAGAIPAAYNAHFDRSFLLAEMARVGKSTDDPSSPPAVRPSVEWVDPLEWVFLLRLVRGKNSLGEVAERLGVKLENAHRASDDAEAALRVLYELASDARMPTAYGGLMKEQRRIAKIREQSQFWRRSS